MMSETDTKRLEQAVGEVKRKRKGFVLSKGLLFTAFTVFASIAVVSLLSLIFYNPHYYTFLKAVFLITSIAGAVKFVALPLLKEKDTGDVVAELDSASPGLGEDTLNALLLADDNNKQKNAGTSVELANAHIENVERKLESLDKETLFPKHRLKSITAAAAGALVAAVLILIIIPVQFRGYLLSASLFPPGSKGVIELSDIELTLNYPAYSGLEPETIRGGTGDVKALKGTVVKFSARPLGKFGGGRLVIENGPSLPIEVSGGKIETEFTVTGDGHYHITERDGKEKSADMAITAVPDSAPEVAIESPEGETIELDGDGRIEILYRTSDDFGLGKIKLTAEGEGGKSEKIIKDHKNTPKTDEGAIAWDARSLDKIQGSTVKLRVEVFDNDTINGPKSGVSNAITVKLMDERSKHKEVLNLSERLMEELIETLGDEIEISENMKETQSNQGQEAKFDLGLIKSMQDPLTPRIENAVDTLRTLIAAMSEDTMSDYTYFVGITNMEIRLDSLLDKRIELMDSFSVVDIPGLGRQMVSEIVEFEDDIIFLDNMIKSERLKDSLFSSKELMSKYSELEELMNQMKQGGDSERLMEEIRNKMAEISSLMQELAQKMSAMNTEMQEGFLNPDAFQSQNMQEMMKQMMEMAKEGDMDSAMDMLARMMSGLQGMIASLEGGMQSFGSSTMGQDMAKLGELIARIEGIEKEQNTLKEKTEQLKDSMLGGEGGEENNPRDFIEKQKEKVRELKKSLNDTQSIISKNTPIGKTPEGSYLIDRMLQKADELKNWLDAMDFKQAQRNARNLEESTEGLGQLADAGVGSLRKADREINRSNELAEEIRQNLEQFSPEGGSRAPSSGIAERQDEIQEETGELSEQASELAKNLPLSPEIGEKLGEAGGYMGKASQRLSEKEISKAISNEDEAIKSLQQAKAKAEQAMKQMGMSARGQGMPTPMALGQRGSGGRQGVDTRYVEIPKTDESLVGKNLKESIMEAMKGGSPEGYGELNKKYYDRIIK